MKEQLEWSEAQYWNRPWNPWIGCEAESPACANCYARDIVRRFNMTGVDSSDFRPVKKENRSGSARIPTKGVVFCGNMTDLFGRWVPPEERVQNIVRTTGNPNATYLWLTKRPFNMAEAVASFLNGPHEVRNQWFGFTAEDQTRYDERIVAFEWMPERANLWISAEPLLGPLDLDLNGAGRRIGWVVVGCESGPKRRPCSIEWIEDVVRQCASADHPVKVFVKQLNIGGKCVNDVSAFPDGLRVRQVPWFQTSAAGEVRR